MKNNQLERNNMLLNEDHKKKSAITYSQLAWELHANSDTFDAPYAIGNLTVGEVFDTTDNQDKWGDMAPRLIVDIVRAEYAII